MNEPMKRLDRLLSDLPPERASDDFTARLMKRIEDPPRRSRRHGARRLLWTAVAAGAGAIALLVVLSQTADRDLGRDKELSAEIAELRRQHEALTRELANLRQRNESAAPVLYLGSIDEVDYVVDLSPFLLASSGRASGTPAGDNTTYQRTRDLP